jgi:hypothetical protein
MVTDGMRDAPIPQRKAILQKFLSEVRVQSRHATHPVFRLPSVGCVNCSDWWAGRESNPHSFRGGFTDRWARHVPFADPRGRSGRKRTRYGTPDGREDRWDREDRLTREAA